MGASHSGEKRHGFHHLVQQDGFDSLEIQLREKNMLS